MADNTTDKWNFKSKRCLVLAFVDVIWAILLFTNPPTAIAISPWVGAINAVWILGESYRPSGVIETAIRNILGTKE